MANKVYSETTDLGDVKAESTLQPTHRACGCLVSVSERTGGALMHQ